MAGYVVSRRAFDKRLALDAEGAGAELWHPRGVTRVHGDQIEFAEGPSVQARVIIGADGPLSTVARGVGYHPAREMYRMITASSPTAFPDEIDLHFGRVAPGGYAWIFPRIHDVNVGLGAVELPSGTSLDGLLNRFVDRVGLPPVSERTRWWVPIGPPPESALRGRALLVGDAANLVMATNGGGIPTAMISGRDAGVVAAEYVRSGAPLTEYDRLWKQHLYLPLARAHDIKRFGDHVIRHEFLLALAMRYIGAAGLDSMMRLRWPARLGRGS
jgi:digeranylgeranylglycerophospholipid reductase